MDNFSTIITLLHTYGPFALVAVFFLWRDTKREDSLTKRIDELESETREVLIPLIEKTTEVITRNTVAMERMERRLWSSVSASPSS